MKIINLPTVKRNMFSSFLFLFLFYITIYGVLSINQESLFIRSIKDFLLVFLIFVSFLWVIFNKKYQINIYLFLVLVSLFSLYLLGILGLLGGSDLSSFIYGVKITLLPISCLVFGVFLQSRKINLLPILLIIFIVLPVVWILQWNIGVEQLLMMGFEYGVNVKHFSQGIPRLPSIVGTPDSYAFMLAISGLILENLLLNKNFKKFAFIVKLITILFLIFSTIRSAILFYLLCQLVVFIIKLQLNVGRKIYLYVFFLCSIIGILTIVIPFMISSQVRLFSTHSILDRFSHWFENLSNITSVDGLIGLGLGTVGSASVRISDLGINTADYAVDNQYFAIYQQLGIMGIFFYILLFSSILMMLINNYKIVREQKNFSGIRNLSLAIGLIIAISVSGLFSNVVEIYPFNIFFFMFIGMQMHPGFFNNQSFKLK